MRQFAAPLRFNTRLSMCDLRFVGDPTGFLAKKRIGQSRMSSDNVVLLPVETASRPLSLPLEITTVAEALTVFTRLAATSELCIEVLARASSAGGVYPDNTALAGVREIIHALLMTL